MFISKLISKVIGAPGRLGPRVEVDPIGAGGDRRACERSA